MDTKTLPPDAPSEQRSIAIPEELLEVLSEFLRGKRNAGSITVTFSDGGIDDFEAKWRKVFKLE